MSNKTSNIYPWVVVGLLWGVLILKYVKEEKKERKGKKKKRREKNDTLLYI